ncbi:hypothetical protein HGRIS_003168 [Hohenbuehelia grisea]|uniref:ADP-ribosylation factor n=1 Tax=Hohenbuehelia grisea TaxID=104357 RepID=A0ABR3JPT1_9AGAR
MATVLQSLISRLLKSRQRFSAVIMGLDYSGKTSILYRLRLNELVQAIPTTGFNVEEVTPPKLRSRDASLTMTCWDVGAGCGGITYMLRTMSIYAETSDAIIWVVDSCDRERLTESWDALQKVRSYLPEEKRKSLPVLVLANKQDMAGAIPVDDIRRTFMQAASGITLNVFKASASADVAKGGLPEAFYWLQIVLSSGSPPAPLTVEAVSRPAAKKPAGIPQEDLAIKLETWIDRALNDSSPDEFLEQFKTLSLPSWDHYTHIRLAYTILTRYGRQIGKTMIFDGIQRYIAESSQTRGRTFHETMTYFWVQIVHFGIRSLPEGLEAHRSTEKPAGASPEPVADGGEDVDLGDVASITTLADDGTRKRGADKPGAREGEDFARFLLMSPYVVNGNLWMEFYTKEVIMTPQAKGEMVLPDKRPLPNLVIRDAIPGATGKPNT